MLLFISLAGMVGQNIKKKLKKKRKKGKKIQNFIKKVFVGVLIFSAIVGYLYAYGFWNITSNEHICPNKNVSSYQVAKYEDTIPQHNLPSAPTPFVGRNNELKEITALFYKDEKDIIVINGPPAFGKSALAIHVGYSMLQQNIDVAYIDAPESPLFRQSDSKVYSSEVLSFSVPGDNYEDWLMLLVKSLNRTSLLILDNLDNVLVQNKDATLTYILKLYESAQQHRLKILITTQHHISLPDRFQQFIIDELDPAWAVELLKELTKDKVNISRPEKLVEMAGFCPLAIKVVAALLNKPKMNGSDWLLAELENKAISTSCDATFPSKYCWKALMDIAYNKLSKEAQDCGKYVSFFPGSFDDVARGLILPNPNCIETLVVSSLIEKKTHINIVRYTMHKLITQYFEAMIDRNLTPFSMNYSIVAYNITLESLVDTMHMLIIQFCVEMFDWNRKPNLKKAFLTYYSTLAYDIASGSGSTQYDYLFIEIHNLQRMVTIAISKSQTRSHASLIAVSFIHSKRLLPSNTLWLDLFHFYNTPKFNDVCQVLGENICADLLIEVLDMIPENIPFVSCDILSLLNTEPYMTTSEWYCEAQRNIINYFFLFPYMGLFVICSTNILVNFFFYFFKVDLHLQEKYSILSYIIVCRAFNYFYIVLSYFLIYNTVAFSLSMFYGFDTYYMYTFMYYVGNLYLIRVGFTCSVIMFGRMSWMIYVSSTDIKDKIAPFTIYPCFMFILDTDSSNIHGYSFIVITVQTFLFILKVGNFLTVASGIIVSSFCCFCYYIFFNNVQSITKSCFNFFYFLLIFYLFWLFLEYYFSISFSEFIFLSS